MDPTIPNQTIDYLVGIEEDYYLHVGLYDVLYLVLIKETGQGQRALQKI